jgi:hypothetical protein
LETLTEKGYKIYKLVIFNCLFNYINEAILSLIADERDGNMVDTGLLKNIIEVYNTLSSDERSKTMQDSTCL